LLLMTTPTNINPNSIFRSAVHSVNALYHKGTIPLVVNVCQSQMRRPEYAAMAA
jgi:hypothetical protein